MVMGVPISMRRGRWIERVGRRDFCGCRGRSSGTFTEASRPTKCAPPSVYSLTDSLLTSRRLAEARAIRRANRYRPDWQIQQEEEDLEDQEEINEMYLGGRVQLTEEGVQRLRELGYPGMEQEEGDEEGTVWVRLRDD